MMKGCRLCSRSMLQERRICTFSTPWHILSLGLEAVRAALWIERDPLLIVYHFSPYQHFFLPLRWSLYHLNKPSGQQGLAVQI